MPEAPRSPELVGDFPALCLGDPHLVSRDAPISAAVERLLARPQSRMVYVVDSDRKLVGVVSFRSLLAVTKARYGARSSGVVSFVQSLRAMAPETVGDIMRPATSIRRDTPLREALVQMHETQQNDLPIVDEAGRVVGEFNGMHVLALARDVMRRTETDLARARGGLGDFVDGRQA